MLTTSWVKSSRSKQNWIPETYLFKININMYTYIYKSTYRMFVSWILNFQVNFRKIISLEPHMKLERLVDEVFVRICIFYMPKLSAATGKLAIKWLIFFFFGILISNVLILTMRCSDPPPPPRSFFWLPSARVARTGGPLLSIDRQRGWFRWGP